MDNKQLYQTAKEAIESVFSDTSVSQEQTLENLEVLADDIGMYIDAIESDLAGQ